MLLKVCLLLASVASLHAAPSKADLSTSEGRNLAAYAAPVQPSTAKVTSYNRRGPAVAQQYAADKPAHYDIKPAAHQYGHASQYAKPSIYGSSYPQPSIRSPVYSPEPQAPHGYSSQALDYPGPAPGYGSYGPQTNAYSEQSRHLSQDPSYDPAKDPVSRYAEYVPSLEYGSKGHSNGNELSIYGYRK